MIDNQIMVFPKTFKEFANMFSIKDTDEVYSNGIDFIPVFRVEQWLEHTRKKGKWIKSSIPDSVLSECNVCGFKCGSWSFKYCPMCGAEMEVEE